MAARRKQQRDSGGSDLDAMVRSGPAGAYEALQLYKSRCNRFKLKQDYIQAIEIAGKGCKALCRDYEKAGAELASIFVELLVESGQDCSQDLRSLVNDIDSAFPEKSALRADFLLAALKWTAKCGSRELGDPMLHQRLGLLLTELGDKTKAVYHLTMAEAPELVWTAIKDLPPVERDALLAFAVCHFLSLESIRDASVLTASYRKAVPGAASDLVQFADYLQQTCLRDAGPLFQTLVQTYAPLLQQYPAILQLVVGPIALTYFGMRQQARPDMMSMLSNMMGGGGGM
jgi:hypothetical protein